VEKKAYCPLSKTKTVVIVSSVILKLYRNPVLDILVVLQFNQAVPYSFPMGILTCAQPVSQV
jgi:hypothetical protein